MRFRRPLLLTGLLATAGALTAAAPPPPQPAVSVHTQPAAGVEVDSRRRLSPALTMTTLANGLTVIVEENHAAPLCTVRIFVKNTGSAFEERHLGAGISHLLEHLVSSGTTSRHTEDQFRRLIDGMGGSANAYTSSSETVYFIDAAPRHVDTCIDLLADMVQNCLFEPSEVQREREVVQRELTMGLAQRHQMLWQLNQMNVYGDHPARHPIIGYRDVLASLTRDDLVAFYRDRYVPDHMAVVVVGAVDTEQVLQRVRTAFAGAKRRLRPPIVLPEPLPVASPREVSRPMDGELVDLVMSFPTIPLRHPDLYALDLMSYILTAGDSARLTRALKHDRQLVVSIASYSHTPAFWPGCLSVQAEVRPEQLPEARQALLAELDRLRREPVGPAELAKAKKQKAAEHVFARQRVQDRAAELGHNWVCTGDPLFGDRYVDGIQQVTAEAILQAARRYLDPSRLCVAMILPRTRAVASRPAAAAPSAGRTQKLTLANGLRVLLKRLPAAPLVALQAYYNAGVLVESDRTNGLCHLATTMLTKGTTRHTAQEIADYFDSIGGRLQAAGGRHTGYLTAEVLKADFAPTLEIVADMIRRPTFPDEELQRLRGIVLATIRNRQASLYTELDDLVRAHLPPTTPYRYDVLGTEASVSALTRDDLVQFHTQYVVPNNLVLAVYGDVDLAEAEALVRRHFESMPPRPELRLPRFTQPFVLDQTRRVTKTNQKPSAGIRFIFPTTSLYDEADSHALKLLFAVLAGYRYPGGWLHQELRGAGLVYVVHGMNVEGVAPGYATIYAECEPAKVDEVISRIEARLADAQAGRLSLQEFQEAKRRVLAFEEIQGQTAAEQAAQEAVDELYGLGYDHRARMLAALRQVQLADLKRVGRKYIGPRLIAVAVPPSDKP